MTTFNYYANIPNAPDNPSYDQPLMQINSQSINSLVNVDHLTFKAAQEAAPQVSDGQHKQVTLPFQNIPMFTPTDPLSVAYTQTVAAPGAFNTASASSVSELFYLNNSAKFILSCVKAFGYFDTNCTSLNTWNLAGVISGGPNNFTYTMTMPTNCVTGTNYLIIAMPITSTAGLFPITSITNATTFTLRFSTLAGSFPSSFFSVIVLQL